MTLTHDGVKPSLPPPHEADADGFASEVAEACRQAATSADSLNGQLARRDLAERSSTYAPIVPRPPFHRRLFPRVERPEYAEAFRLLALNMRQVAASTSLRSILVMGALPGDGRTLTAANLGVALAGTGCRVVLMESDGRKPQLARLFGAAPEAWAAEAPLNVDRPRAAPTGVPNLAVVLPVARDGVLARMALPPLLAALRSVADFVILDSPPCLQFADGFLLSTHTNGVLYVVRRRQQDAAAQRAVQEQLARLGANVLGVVFNEA
jgi:Mrp family chromosome partitioning ATPase